jgi:hypothetical protein
MQNLVSDERKFSTVKYFNYNRVFVDTFTHQTSIHYFESLPDFFFLF